MIWIVKITEGVWGVSLVYHLAPTNHVNYSEDQFKTSCLLYQRMISSMRQLMYLSFSWSGKHRTSDWPSFVLSTTVTLTRIFNLIKHYCNQNYYSLCRILCGPIHSQMPNTHILSSKRDHLLTSLRNLYANTPIISGNRACFTLNKLLPILEHYFTSSRYFSKLKRVDSHVY